MSVLINPYAVAPLVTGLEITGGTIITDMDTRTAAGRDGTTNQAAGAATKHSGNTTHRGYGITPASPSLCSKATIHGTNDTGYSEAGAGVTITATLRGKTGAAPSNYTSDGTQLGQIVFSNLANESAGRDITSADVTVWDHIWVDFLSSSSNSQNLAEVKLYH